MLQEDVDTCRHVVQIMTCLTAAVTAPLASQVDYLQGGGHIDSSIRVLFS